MERGERSVCLCLSALRQYMLVTLRLLDGLITNPDGPKSAEMNGFWEFLWSTVKLTFHI